MSAPHAADGTLHQLDLAVRRTRAQLYRQAVTSVGPDAADDVVQETYLRAYRAWASYDPTRGSLDQWLQGIARRAIADHHRARARHRRNDAATLADRPEDPSADLTDRLAAAGVAAAIVGAVAALSPGDADLLELVAQGTPIVVAAGMLGLHAGTARSKLHALRQRLRSIVSYHD